jgi:hypothetical protein
MRHCRNTRPQLEVLESMTLLSALAHPLAYQGGPILVHPLVHQGGPIQITLGSGTEKPVSLKGTLKGNYHLSGAVIADTGLDYVFSGKGTIGALGHVDMTGNMHSLGYIAEGRATGSIILSIPKGSMTLQLTGPEQNGFAHLPDHFKFKITNTSGKYLGDTATGTVVFVRDPARTSASPEHGAFTMVFVS